MRLELGMGGPARWSHLCLNATLRSLSRSLLYIVRVLVTYCVEVCTLRLPPPSHQVRNIKNCSFASLLRFFFFLFYCLYSPGVVYCAMLQLQTPVANLLKSVLKETSQALPLNRVPPSLPLVSPLSSSPRRARVP